MNTGDNYEWTSHDEREYNRWLDESYFLDIPTSDELAAWQVASNWHNSIPDAELDKLALLGDRLLKLEDLM